jgi:hypothetical protein
MDDPSLPPLPLPDGHDTNDNAIPFLIRQYIIEGVQDLPQELRSHVPMFYEDLITLMKGALESWQLISKKKYTTILTARIRICDGEPVKLPRLIYPKIYKWYKNMPSLPVATVSLSWNAFTMPTVMPAQTRMLMWRDGKEAHIF